MHYSDEQVEKDLAKQFSLTGNDSIFKDYFSMQKTQGNEQNQNSEVQKNFIANVLMAMTKALRNLALVRETHVSSVKSLENDYRSEESYLDDISSFGSASSNSIFAKFLPFFGGGSALTFALNATEQEKSISVLESSLPPIDEFLPSQGLPFGLTVESMILLFIASGIGVMTAATLFLKARKKFVLGRMRKRIEEYADNDWKVNARPDSIKCLMQLYEDLRIIMGQFYPSYADDDPGFVDSNRKFVKVDDAEGIISKEIIVPESVNPASRLLDIKSDKQNSEGSNDGESGG